MTFTWTGAAGDGLFNTPSNWSTNSVPDNSQPTTIATDLNGTTTTSIFMANSVQLDSLDITGGGTLAFTGAPGFVLQSDNNITMVPGTTLDMGTGTLSALSSIDLGSSGGIFTISHATVLDNGELTVNAGQTFVLDHASYTSSSGIDGGGTLALVGSTVTFVGAAPTVHIDLSTVFSGDTPNVINLPDFPPNISGISNLGFGTTINFTGAGIGITLALTPNTPGGSVYTLQSNDPVNHPFVVSTNVTLEPHANLADFVFSSNGDVTYIGAAPCFCAGTLILTERGEVAVEDLRVGDLVITASGQANAVQWLGRTVVHAASRLRPEKVWPICVSRDAFGEGLPRRDLWLSPGHCIASEGSLIPVDVLINDRTIVQRARATIEYWHVELDSHDVLMAEGLACESYLDTGNRIGFVNGGVSRDRKRCSETCLPHATSGPAVEKTKALLLEQAKTIGFPVTSDPDLHIVADGQRIDALPLGDKRYLFVLPAGRRTITLCSRVFTPCETIAFKNDPRLLGVSVTRLQLDGDDLPLDSALASGWHELERNKRGLFRWTDGATPVPAGTRAVLVDLGVPGVYWEEETAAISLVA